MRELVVEVDESVLGYTALVNKVEDSKIIVRSVRLVRREHSRIAAIYFTLEHASLQALEALISFIQQLPGVISARVPNLPLI